MHDMYLISIGLFQGGRPMNYTRPLPRGMRREVHDLTRPWFNPEISSQELHISPCNVLLDEYEMQGSLARMGRVVKLSFVEVQSGEISAWSCEGASLS
jgi:hypothetical protein